jgi:hypothetical protein
MTDASGNVLERYTYDGYGAVTVRNEDGTVRGDGTIASSTIGSRIYSRVDESMR